MLKQLKEVKMIGKYLAHYKDQALDQDKFQFTGKIRSYLRGMHQILTQSL